MMDTRIGCSTCSTSSPTNAWRRKWSCQGPDSIKSKPIGQSSDEAKRREEVSGELVITRGDAAEVLEATEAALDDVATFVGQLVIANARLAIGLAGNAWFDCLLLEIGAQRISVITFVSDQFRHARDPADALLSHDAIGGVSRSPSSVRPERKLRQRLRGTARVDYQDAIAAGLGVTEHAEGS